MSFTEQVEQYLSEHPRPARARVSIAADHFQVSETTVMRWLHAEGSRFHRLLEAECARRDQALSRQDLKPHQIANALGFSNNDSYRNAKKRWEARAAA